MTCCQKSPLFPEYSVSMPSTFSGTSAWDAPPHLSPASSYSSLKAQLRGHLLRDACPNFPVRSLAPSSRVSYYTFCRVLTSPITSYILFPMALGGGSQLLCFRVARPARTWHSEKGSKECGSILAPKVIACLTFLFGSKAASGF